MDLLIVRHAIAFERDRNRWKDDTQRPLSPEGMQRARHAAAGLRHLVKAPERLFTSPLVRARQTADILTDVARWPQPLETPELAPGMPLQQVLDLLAQQQHACVAVVGHQPDLGRLLGACLLGSHPPELPVDLKKPGVVCVSFDKPVRAGRGTLKWFASPHLLRLLRKSKQ